MYTFYQKVKQGNKIVGYLLRDRQYTKFYTIEETKKLVSLGKIPRYVLTSSGKIESVGFRMSDMSSISILDISIETGFKLALTSIKYLEIDKDSDINDQTSGKLAHIDSNKCLAYMCEYQIEHINVDSTRPDNQRVIQGFISQIHMFMGAVNYKLVDYDNKYTLAIQCYDLEDIRHITDKMKQLAKVRINDNNVKICYNNNNVLSTTQLRELPKNKKEAIKLSRAFFV